MCTRLMKPKGLMIKGATGGRVKGEEMGSKYITDVHENGLMLPSFIK